MTGAFTALRRQGRSALTFLGIFTVAHAALSVLALVGSYAAGMRSFDSGARPTLIEQTLDSAADLLLSPIFTGLLDHEAGRLFPGLLGYLPVLLNSLLWALAAWLLLRLTWMLLGRG